MYHWQGGLDGQTQESGVLDSCHFGSGCHSGFVHSLASFVRWTGRCCLYPRGSRDYKASNKVRERSHCKTSWSWDWNLLVACRCIACLRDYSDTHHGGTDGPIRGEPHTLTRTLAVSHVNQWKCSSWGSNQRCSAHCHPCFSTRGGGDLVSCILSMQDITLRRTTDPHIPGGPGSEHPC